MTAIRDPWANLRDYTAARIALGRTGDSQQTTDLLAFQLDHARARDAIHLPLDVVGLQAALQPQKTVVVQSRAKDRAQYLQRPDLGRLLSPDGTNSLPKSDADVAIIIADGLSSTAVNSHATAVTHELLKHLSDLSLAPLVIATEARVALGDEIGAALGAKLTVLLIGERPGLSAPDSLGCYLTYGPKPGLQNAARNCVSNIRPNGLGYNEAASKIAYLVRGAFKIQATGIALKDDAGTLLD